MFLRPFGLYCNAYFGILFVLRDKVQIYGRAGQPTGENTDQALCMHTHNIFNVYCFISDSFRLIS